MDRNIQVNLEVDSTELAIRHAWTNTDSKWRFYSKFKQYTHDKYFQPRDEDETQIDMDQYQRSSVYEDEDYLNIYNSKGMMDSKKDKGRNISTDKGNQDRGDSNASEEYVNELDEIQIQKQIDQFKRDSERKGGKKESMKNKGNDKIGTE